MGRSVLVLCQLDTGGDIGFKPRPIEGAPAAASTIKPQSLLLDGQQRMTSLYQVELRGEVIHTITPKKKEVKRWFFNIMKALDPAPDRKADRDRSYSSRRPRKAALVSYLS